MSTRGLEDGADYFRQHLDLTAPTRDNDIKPPQPDPGLVGKNWHKPFLARHPALKSMYSRALDNERAVNNDPKILAEYFYLLNETLVKCKIRSCNIYNMDEKGFLIGLINR